MKIRAPKDFFAGLMFTAIGAGFMIGATQYPMGSAVRMGPAYFPSILGGLLTLLGVIIFVTSFFIDGERPRSIQWRPLLLILSGVLLFAWIIGPFNLGVVAATAVVVLVSAMGGWEFRWKEGIISAIVLAVTVPLMFYYGLGLPFKIFPWSF